MTEPALDVRRALPRYALFLGLAAAVAVALVAIGWWPTRHLAGAGGTGGLVAGCAIAWFGSALGGLPVMLAEATGRSTVALVLASSAVRPVAVVAVAAAVAVSGRLPAPPLLVWTALGHLALLVVDTLYAAGAWGARTPVFGPAGGAGGARTNDSASRTSASRTGVTPE